MFEQVEVNSERWFDLKDLKNEEWKSLSELDDFYLISNYGRIKSLKKCKILKLCSNFEGYYDNAIKIGDKVKHIKVGRTVAKMFIPNDNSDLVVNHIDGNKKNDRVDNLEWITQRENSIKAIEMGLRNSDRELYDEDYIIRKNYRKKYLEKVEKENLRKSFINIKYKQKTILIMSLSEADNIFNPKFMKKIKKKSINLEKNEIKFELKKMSEEDLKSHEKDLLGNLETKIEYQVNFKDV